MQIKALSYAYTCTTTNSRKSLEISTLTNTMEELNHKRLVKQVQDIWNRKLGYFASAKLHHCTVSLARGGQ